MDFTFYLGLNLYPILIENLYFVCVYYVLWYYVLLYCTSHYYVLVYCTSQPPFSACKKYYFLRLS